MRRDVFQAIADPIRREIIQLLSENPCTVNEIADQFAISRPAISKHLKILKECGLLQIEQNGRERLCHINPQNLIPAFLWINRYKSLWEDRLDNFEDYINELQAKNNNK